MTDSLQGEILSIESFRDGFFELVAHSTDDSRGRVGRLTGSKVQRMRPVDFAERLSKELEVPITRTSRDGYNVCLSQGVVNCCWF